MLYLSKSVEASYGPEEEIAAANAAAAAEAAAALAAKVASDSAKFTTDDVNKIVQTRVKKMQETLEKTETSYKELLASKNLTEQERKSLEENLSAVQGQLRTKEQQAQLERKQMEEKHAAEVAEIESKGKTWETLYRDSTVDRALVDAGIKYDAFQPGQIMTQLRPWTRMVEVMDETTKRGSGKYKVVVDFPDVNATTGEPEMTTRSPEEAVKRMRELPDNYGNLFKTGVVSGIGVNSTGGAAPGGDGKLSAKQISALTPAKYREIREKNPELLGLRPNKRGS